MPSNRGTLVDAFFGFETLTPTTATFEWTMGSQLVEEERQRLLALLTKYEDCFAFSAHQLGRCTVLEFCITLTDKTPIFWRRHHLSPHEWELVD